MKLVNNIMLTDLYVFMSFRRGSALSMLCGGIFTLNDIIILKKYRYEFFYEKTFNLMYYTTHYLEKYIFRLK